MRSRFIGHSFSEGAAHQPNYGPDSYRYHGPHQKPEWRPQSAFSPRGQYLRPFWVEEHGEEYLILARQALDDASPQDRNRGKRLILKECTGTFYIVTADLGKPLLAIDNAIADMFLKISRGEADPLDRETAAYMRQLVDNFLYGLYKSTDIGNYRKPIRLLKIEHEPMLNALRNLKEGRPWYTGVPGAQPTLPQSLPTQPLPRRLRPMVNRQNPAAAGPSRPTVARPPVTPEVRRTETARPAAGPEEDEVIEILSDDEPPGISSKRTYFSPPPSIVLPTS